MASGFWVSTELNRNLLIRVFNLEQVHGTNIVIENPTAVCIQDLAKNLQRVQSSFKLETRLDFLQTAHAKLVSASVVKNFCNQVILCYPCDWEIS